MLNPNMEINYPISPTVLIDYLTEYKMFCPFFMGISHWQFSFEPYWGKNSKRPSKDKLTTIKIDEPLTRESTKQLLTVLNLSIDDFEEYVQYK